MSRLAIFLVATFLIGSVQAEAFSMGYTPKMQIKYRQDFMTAVKGHNKNIKSIVYGSVPHTKHLQLHLSTLEKMFAEIGTLFPEGSHEGDTLAKKAVWEKPAKFQQSIEKAQQALATFKQVVEQGDQSKTKAALKKYGRASCGNCHLYFKKTKKKSAR